ncbi:MAG: hypothetical protein SNJ76_07985, partial [Fimbriimonadaceae bacterium]
MDRYRKRRRIWAFVAACALAAGAWAQEPPAGPDTSVRLDFEQRAAPVPTVLENLSRASGVRLTSVAAMNSEIAVVRVEGASLQSVMDRIARVTSGEWVRDGNGFRLQADTARRRNEDAADLAARIAEIRRAIGDLQETNRSQTAAPGALGAVQILQRGTGSSAVNAAIGRFLAALDPRLIAQMSGSSRLVFSSNPTMMQRPLPGNASQIVGELVAAHNREVASRPAESTGPANEILDRVRAMGWVPSNRPIDTPPAKVLLSISNDNFGVGLSAVELTLFDREGRVILRGQQMLNLTPGNSILSMAMGGEQPGPRPAPPTFEGPDSPLELSSETAEMVGVVGRIVSGNLTLSRGLEEKLLRPDQYDPLSFGPSEGLIAASKAKRLNLVANLPDSLAGGLGQLMQAMSPGSGPASTVHQFLARMFASSDVQAAIDGGWLTVEPKEPSKSRRERVDRRALAALLADTRRTGTLSLDALAAYAVDNPPPTQSPGALLHIMLMAPGAVGGMQGAMSDWNLLRFWGTLGQAQRETLFRGGTIAFGQLTPVQRTSLERVLFGPNANLRVTQGTGNRTPRGGLMGMVENMLPRPARDFREEPTEIMPTGLPAMGTISASNRVETVAYPAGTSAGRS